MKARAGAYNAKLVFAEKSGAYVADVKLVINGPKGERIVDVMARTAPGFISSSRPVAIA